jgi:hypothetical protein
MSEHIEETPAEPVEQVEASPAPAVEEQPWSLTQQDWEQTQQFLQSVGQALPTIYQEIQGLRPQEQAPQGPAAPEYDPFDPASVSNYIQHAVSTGLESVLEERLGPLQGLFGMVAQERGEALARQQLEQLSTNIGAFDHDTAYLVASGMIERGTDATQALQAAAQYAFDMEQRIRADERSKYTSDLGQLGQAPAEITGWRSTGRG